MKRCILLLTCVGTWRLEQRARSSGGFFLMHGTCKNKQTKINRKVWLLKSSLHFSTLTNGSSLFMLDRHQTASTRYALPHWIRLCHPPFPITGGSALKRSAIVNCIATVVRTASIAIEPHYICNLRLSIRLNTDDLNKNKNMVGCRHSGTVTVPM